MRRSVPRALNGGAAREKMLAMTDVAPEILTAAAERAAYELWKAPWMTADIDHARVREVAFSVAAAVLDVAAPAVREAERERLRQLVVNWQCPCGEKDCIALGARSALARLISVTAPASAPAP